MRTDRHRSLTRLVWRERFASLRLLPLIGFLGLTGLLTIYYDPPRAVGYERATVVSQGHIQGNYRKTRPFMMARLRDMSVLKIEPFNPTTFANGQEVCVVVFESIIFSRKTAELASDEKCGPRH